jgi:4-amino-4-deoxy-L-arabinose transferase-like glycosyltransferase
MGLICWKVFHDPLAAWFAGIAAAGHPILVNSASQPYNENLFFFLFAAALWAFLQWVQTNTLGWAVLCGAMIGLCTLTRENGLVLLMAMGAVTVLAAPGVPRAWTGYGLIIILTIAVVSPWTWRNYHRFGTFIPVASILGEDLAEGNNACVASEGMLVPFWAEGPCPWVEQQREALRQNEILDRRLPPVVLRDRLSRAVALTFIEQHPVSYAKLVFRRFWTTLLPYDPRGNQRGPERIVLTFYWLLVFPAGFAGIARALKHLEPGRLLLLALLGLNLASIAAVLYWSDLRFRVGIDLILACFAGWFYARKLGRSAIFPPLNANSRPPNSLQY